jgi:hypothetical protein
VRFKGFLLVEEVTMKKILAVSVLLNAALVVGVSRKELTAHAAGGGGVPVGNGDVNGDGTIDISDAVYLLTNLFLGGDAPVAIECPAPAGKGLPATGQTKCYSTGGEIACDSADYPGQDGFYKAGCPSEGRFVVNDGGTPADMSDDTVTDTCTGLMWQKDTADVDGNGLIGNEDRLNWQGALKYCDSLSFAGHDDWRLPNVRELQSIVDYGRFDLAIDPVFGALSDWYWSSSSYDSPWNAWVVLFNGGWVGVGRQDVISGKDDQYYFRAVRSGP